MKGVVIEAQASAGGRDSREAILAAVASVIARRGVRGLRVEDVAAEAEVSAPLLYYHFGNRAGLVKAALEHAGERAPSASLRAVSGRSGFESVAVALLGELSDEPEVRDNAVVWGEITASAVFDKELRADVRRANEAWRADVAAAIRTGLDDGSIRPDVDPDAAADALVAMVDGLCTRWLSGTIERARAEELLRDALDRWLGGTP